MLPWSAPRMGDPHLECGSSKPRLIWVLKLSLSSQNKGERSDYKIWPAANSGYTDMV